MATITFGFSELKEEYKDEASVRAMIENEKEDVRERYLDLQQKNPEEFAYLYQMKNNLNLNADDVAAITTDQNGKMALVFSNNQEGEEQFYITALKKEKTGENANFTGSLYIKNADAENFSQEKMNNLVETLANTGVDVKNMHSSDERLAMLLRVINDMAGQGEINALALDDVERQGSKFTGQAAIRFQDALKAMRGAIESKGKRSNCRETTEGGSKVFNLYKFNPANKKGLLPAPDARIYVKDQGNGKVSYKYHMKDNGKLDDEVAGIMVAGMASAGFDSADLSAVPGPDRGALMKALAKKGMIPVGIYISSETDGKMILEELEKSDLSTAERNRVKEKLAASMEAYNRAHGKDSDLDRNFIASLRNAEKNGHLKDMWDNGGLTTTLSNRATQADNPEETLAAMYAMGKVLNAYKNFDSVDQLLAVQVGEKTQQVPHVVIFNTEEEKKKVMTLFAGRENMRMKDVSAGDLKMMNECFMPYGKEHAEDLIRKSVKGYAGTALAKSPNAILTDPYNEIKGVLDLTLAELGKQGCKLDPAQIVKPTRFNNEKYGIGRETTSNTNVNMARGVER